jgi:hypothetical protein
MDRELLITTDRELLINNIVGASKAVGCRLPLVPSTANVKTGLNKPADPPDPQGAKVPTIDRTTINSWEEVEFHQAVEGCKKLIKTALWTEACLTFPALDALAEGYEGYVVVDAVGAPRLRRMRRRCAASSGLAGG